MRSSSPMLERVFRPWTFTTAALPTHGKIVLPGGCCCRQNPQSHHLSAAVGHPVPRQDFRMVITSPRCVQGIIKCLINSKLDGSWSKKPIFVVGEATSRFVVKELNLKPIGADSGNAMALIPAILNYKLNKPLLAPCGNLNINILSSNIKNVEFDNIEVYQTRPHNNLKTNLNLVLNEIEDQIGVIFFSPSGFYALLDLIPKQLFHKMHMFAIGPTTSAAIKEAGHVVSGVCEKPKPESMINMIDIFMNNVNAPPKL